MRRRLPAAWLAAGVVLVLLEGLAGRAAAQGTVTWGEPVNLSNSPTSSTHPAIVADAYGYVHVFWSEDMGGREVEADELGDAPNTILYRRWDGTAWTEPLDVLAVTGDPLADFVAATVDDDSQLHLTWTGLTRLYYSTAPAAGAYSARAWSRPKVIDPEVARSMYESDVAVDSRGVVHIVYGTRGSSTGVFHVMLAPGSATWTEPARIAEPLRADETAFGWVRLAIDASDRLHAAWGTTNTNGYNQAVYYARREASGELWDAPVMLADATTRTGFTGYVSMLPWGRDELLLIHVDQGNKGRVERTSADAGRTWSEPRVILSGMEGVNGFLVPLQDGRGGLHLVINMRPSADQRTGIYYAPRAGADWSPIEPVAVEAPFGPTAHNTDAVVRLGREIHAAWTQLRGGEIWYIRGTIEGIDPLPALATPAAPAVSTTPATAGAPAQAAEVTPTAAGQPETASTVPANRLPAELAAPDGAAPSPWMPIIAAVVPVALLLAGFTAWQRRRR